MSIRDAASVKEFNSRGFGAGGLPPCFFSHLARNWFVGLGESLAGGGAGPHVGGDSSCYGPGMKLMDLLPALHPEDAMPPSNMFGGVGVLGGGGEAGPVKVRRIMVPSSQVRGRRGGRGQKRRRINRTGK